VAVTVSRTKPAPVVIKSHASFRGAGTPLPYSHRERACSNSAPTSPHLHSPRQRRPAPSASSLLHFSSPSPAPSPAARAQKQSRTQEAPDSAATRCRLLEASRAQPQARHHTRIHPDRGRIGEWLRRPWNAGCYNLPELLDSFLHSWIVSWLLSSLIRFRELLLGVF